MTVTRIVNADAATSLAELERALGDMPAALKRARRSVFGKLRTYVNRQILIAVSQSTGIPQARFSRMLRLRSRPLGPGGEDGVSYWIGTNDIPAHKLGTVVWTRRMTGARVGRRSFPGTWIWPRGRTAGLVMERTGQFGRNGDPRLEKIDRVDVEVHATIGAALTRLTPDISERLATLTYQAINYELNVRPAQAGARA
jgi:hypothetical protein